MSGRGPCALLLVCSLALASAMTVPIMVPHQQPQSLGLLGARVAHIQAINAARANPGEHFAAWVARYGKGYANDLTESAKRLAIWLDNLEFATAYNAKTKTHWIGLNHLADLTQEEYRTGFLGFDNAARLAHKAKNAAPTPFRYGAADEAALPSAIDWRKHSAVTAVKNQAQCGSCWAFATTGAVEGANAIFTKELVSLSEQELVDCDTEQDQGCRGGLMDFAYQFIINNGGLDTEEDYPYTATDNTCDIARENRKVVTIDSFEDVPENNEAALKKAVAHQPVAVAIEADQRSFQLYVGGVYTDEDGCGTQLDHGVLAAGYGNDATLGPYWIIKNSWGGDWGEHGYIRMKMGAVAKEGMCGIAMAPSYPVKTRPNPPPSPPTPPTPSPSPPAPSPTPGPGPAPDPDAPQVCDGSSECPPQTTCCCASPAFGMCLQWGCCPMFSATCCDDNEHCCPPTLPICDTAHSRCLPPAGSNAFGSAPWAAKLPAKRTGSMLAAVIDRLGLSKAVEEVQEKVMEVEEKVAQM